MSSELRFILLALLKTSLNDFQRDRDFAAVRGLRGYVRELSGRSGKQIRDDSAKRLIEQADVITGCVSASGISRAESEPAIGWTGGRE